MPPRADVFTNLVVEAYMTKTMTPPSKMHTDALISIWERALTEVPTGQLEAMFYAAMQHDTRDVPGPHDVLAAWRRYQAALPSRTFQEEESGCRAALPNGGDGPARHAFVALRARMKAELGNVVCSCRYGNGDGVAAVLSEDKTHWVCQTNSCDFRWPVSDSQNAPSGGAPGPLATSLCAGLPTSNATPVIAPLPMDDDELLEVLEAKCNFKVSSVTRETAVAFARYLDSEFDWNDITEEVAREAWQAWQQRREEGEGNRYVG